MNAYIKTKNNRHNLTMNTYDIFKLEYKLSRFNRGIIDSFIRAVKAAIRPPAF